MSFFRFLSIVICVLTFTKGKLSAQAANTVGSGNSINFDDIDDRINLGPVLNNLSLPLTIMAWVKPEPQMEINPVFSSSSDPFDWHGIWMHVASNRIQAAFADGDGGFGLASRRVKVSNYTNLHSEWFHVSAVIVNENDMRLYVNGVEVPGTYNGTATQLVNSPTGEADIGYHSRGPSAPIAHFHGDIDEVRLWNIALSESQIRDQMCRQVQASELGLIAAWSFNEANANNTIADVKGVITGTRMGAALTEVSEAPVGNSSVYGYGSQSSAPLILQETQRDSVSVLADPGTDGIHLYKVDAPAVNQNGLDSANIVNHYYGVFSINPNQKYTINYTLTPPFYLPNTFEMAYRNHNASVSWSTFTGYYGPNKMESNRGRHEEYIINGSPCIGPSILPPVFSECNELTVTLPNSVNTIIWDDGDTSRSRLFTQNGTFIISAINQNGCRISDTISIQILEGSFNPLPDVEFCDSVIVNIDPALNNIIWDDGNTNSQRTILSEGSYFYEAIDPNSGCLVLDTFNVKAINTVSTYSDSLFRAGRSYCVGDTVKLNIPASIEVKTLDGLIFNDFEVSSNGIYRLSISEACGVDTIVYVSYDFYDCDCNLYIAEAFTPNNDGINDKIKPLGNCDLTYYQWSIYNRWGILLFESSDPEEFFDGTYNGADINSSVLIYKIAFANSLVQRSYSGTLHLIK